MNLRLSHLTEKRRRYVEAHVDGRLDFATFEEHKGLIDSEILSVRMELSDADMEELDAEALLAFATHLLGNAARMWSGFSLDQRQRFQKLLFPNGLPFADGEFGTTTTSMVFSRLALLQGGKSEVVAHTGIEPVFRP